MLIYFCSDFKCFKHNLCSNGDCKLNERQRTGDSCNWDLVTANPSSNPNTVYIQSPKHSCDSNRRYYNKLYCVYNISLPGCNTTGNGGVSILFNEDHIDIVDNSPCRDYVQIVDSIGVREKQCGEYNDLAHTQYDIADTNFLVIFFSDKTQKDTGFQLTAQCAT